MSTTFRLLKYDPRRKTCRALMRLKVPLNGTHERVNIDVWCSRRMLLFDLELHPHDPELRKALEHYKSGKVYRAK